MPVLILLLFFINDHYRFYELRNKIKNSAYIVANLMQQLGNIRANKQLSVNDLRDISFASCLNFFHTNTMFDPFPFGMRYIAHFYWVKRVNEDSYQYQKSWACAYTEGNTPADMNKTVGSIQTKNKASIIAIYPDLVCNYDGEEKLLIDCVYRKWGTPDKKQMGFLVLTPPLIKSVDGMTDNFFTYSLVITPKPGIFPATNEVVVVDQLGDIPDWWINESDKMTLDILNGILNMKPFSVDKFEQLSIAGSTLKDLMEMYESYFAAGGDFAVPEPSKFSSWIGVFESIGIYENGKYKWRGYMDDGVTFPMIIAYQIAKGTITDGVTDATKCVQDSINDIKEGYKQEYTNWQSQHSSDFAAIDAVKSGTIFANLSAENIYYKFNRYYDYVNLSLYIPSVTAMMSATNAEAFFASADWNNLVASLEGYPVVKYDTSYSDLVDNKLGGDISEKFERMVVSYGKCPDKEAHATEALNKLKEFFRMRMREKFPDLSI